MSFIENFIYGIINNDPVTSITEFENLDTFYVTAMICGWISRTRNYSLIERKCANTFVWLLVEYLDNNPEIKEEIVKSIFGKNTKMFDHIAIPLNDMDCTIPHVLETNIYRKMVCIPMWIFDEIMLSSFYKSYEKMLTFFVGYLNGSTREQMSIATSEVIEYIQYIAETLGPWHVYEMTVNPLHKFAVIVLFETDTEYTVMSVVDIRDKISAYFPHSKWEVVFKDRLLGMDDVELMNMYQTIYQSNKIPELSDVTEYTISLKKNSKIRLNTIDDIEYLESFPCFKKAIGQRNLPHKIRLNMFSILLWFYSVDDCHQILKDVIKVLDYDPDISDSQLRSLLDTDGNPKYFYGTRGFGSLCIGYHKCQRCWINALQFPETYYQKKKLIRNRYRSTH